MCLWNKAQAERISCKSYDITVFLSQSLLFFSQCLTRICILMRIFNVFTLTDANTDAPMLLCCHLKETSTFFFLLYLQGFYLPHLSDFSLNPPIQSNQILLTVPLKGVLKRCVFVFLQVFVVSNREIHNVSNSLGALCRNGLCWADKPKPRAVKKKFWWGITWRCSLWHKRPNAFNLPTLNVYLC